MNGLEFLSYVSILAMAFATTCTAKPIHPPPPIPGHGSPAAYHCDNSRGKYESTDQPEEIGLCTFGDKKATIGAWTFFRFRHGQPQKAVAAFCASKNNPETKDFPGPQNDFCTKVGGIPTEYRVSSRTTDQAVMICVFDDNSHVEVNTLFKGAKDDDNKSLNQDLCCLFDTGC
jgi:hypothetical protein